MSLESLGNYQIWIMHPYLSKRRLIFTGIYLLVTFAALYWFYSDNLFCSGIRELRAIVALSLTLTLFEVLAGGCGFLLRRFLKGEVGIGLATPLSSALVCGLLTLALPTYLYRGYGAFYWEGAWADMGCLFREGYALVFPILGTATFASLTFVCELLYYRESRKKLADTDE